MDKILVNGEMVDPRRIRIYPEWRACPELDSGDICKLTVGLPPPNDCPRFCKEIRESAAFRVMKCEMGHSYSYKTENGRWLEI